MADTAKSSEEPPNLKRAFATVEAARAKEENGNPLGSPSLAPPAKRPRLASSRSPSPPSGPDPYTTLPPPTKAYITLRFQLARFTGVFRVVRVPLNYTFAHLHTLVQFYFGWKGRAHNFRVYSHVTMYTASNRAKAGQMKRFGCAPPVPDSWLTGHNDKMQRDMWKVINQNASWWEVVPGGQRDRQSLEEQIGIGGKDFNYRERKEDGDVTLGMVWNREGGNLTEGECADREIAIAYAASWDVHITLESDNAHRTVNSPSNLPILVQAKGAPPVEDAFLEAQEEVNPKCKTLHNLFYQLSTFERYCTGELGTANRPTKLEIFNAEAERRRIEDCNRQMLKRVRENRDLGEYDKIEVEKSEGSGSGFH
ncbi:hypothetical protein D9615_005403 [Tricholomella constricta]|uniref:Uncharacterized protein n=1 Tax=Tricholomella constricta TaxID=117010 RepID=A0A8H5HE07_9AGAR|nr:hypothetical protein D9615_005403 [Tricholomella constricta]